MAEKLLGPRSRSTAAGSTSSSRTTRTSWRSRVRAGTSSRSIWMHNGMLRFTRREDVEVRSATSRRSQEVLDEWGRGDDARSSSYGALAQADRLLRGDDGGRACTCGRDPRNLPQSVRAGARRVVGALRVDARRRLQHARCACAPARVARPRARAARARRLRPRGARRGGRGAVRGATSSRGGGRRRARAATSPRPTGCGRRSSPRAGTCATIPDGYRLVPRR